MNHEREASPSLIERSLVEIWNTALGRADVAPTENFFDLGGDSLLALVTIEQINQRLGWELDLGDLLRYPTIRTLIAGKAQGRAANPDRAIVRMSNRGARTPVILVHPVSGLIFAYAKLVQGLGADRGCYGIQSPVLMDADVPDTIEGIADRYVELIADELGEDPFHLVGWSVGGVIALEIARRAAARGLGLQRLVLVDSYLWDVAPFEASEATMLREFRADLLAQVFPDPDDRPVDGTHEGPSAVFREIAAALFGPAADAGTRFVDRLYQAYRINFRALAGYRPTPAPVAALLLHAPANYTLATWRRVVQGELTVEAAATDHFGLLRADEAADLATRIETYCNRDQG